MDTGDTLVKDTVIAGAGAGVQPRQGAKSRAKLGSKAARDEWTEEKKWGSKKGVRRGRGAVVVDRKGEGFGEGRKANTKKKPIVRDVAPKAGNSRISEALIRQIIGDAGKQRGTVFQQRLPQPGGATASGRNTDT